MLQNPLIQCEGHNHHQLVADAPPDLFFFALIVVSIVGILASSIYYGKMIYDLRRYKRK